MKNIIAVICIVILLTGCTTYDIAKSGVADGYGGIKAIAGDAFGVIGKVFEGGSLTISITGDAKHNNEEVKP